MLIKADIHIHTCLSPCAEITQSPKRVVEKAFKSGLKLMFITDHNTIENAQAAINASKMYSGLNVLPGMEITSREEVHTLALFENIHDAYQTQEQIFRYLPGTSNKKEFENQIIANENDEVEGYLKKSLFSAVDLSLKEILDLIHENRGIVIAAHVDRESFSVVSQLGFIPNNLKYDALEISPSMSFEQAKLKYPEYLNKYLLLKGSDSHSLNTIGSSYTEYNANDNTFKSFVDYINEGSFITYS